MIASEIEQIYARQDLQSEADRRRLDYKLKMKQTSLFSFHQLRKILKVNLWQVDSEKQIRFGTRWCRSV